VLGTAGLTGNNAAFTTTGAAATRAAADTSAYSTGYDGILPTVSGRKLRLQQQQSTLLSAPLIRAANSKQYSLTLSRVS
jgi:hypothetical protein